MLYTLVFWIIIGLLLLLLITGFYIALKKNGQDENRGQGDEASTIYASGVYSLIRKSPKAELLTREPSLSAIEEVFRQPLVDGSSPNAPAQEYLEKWRSIANISINNIEKGDRDGVQTYRYQVPKKCKMCCAMFAGDAYVTREQLHNHVQLIPPFHLGCGVELVTKNAWSPGEENVGWSPILPLNGKYTTPDWRIVVKL